MKSCLMILMISFICAALEAREIRVIKSKKNKSLVEVTDGKPLKKGKFYKVNVSDEFSDFDEEEDGFDRGFAFSIDSSFMTESLSISNAGSTSSDKSEFKFSFYKNKNRLMYGVSLKLKNSEDGLESSAYSFNLKFFPIENKKGNAFVPFGGVRLVYGSLEAGGEEADGWGYGGSAGMMVFPGGQDYWALTVQYGIQKVTISDPVGVKAEAKQKGFSIGIINYF